MPWIAGCRLLHRDPWVLIVEKPSGLLSQPGLGPAQADSLLSQADSVVNRAATVASQADSMVSQADLAVSQAD